MLLNIWEAVYFDHDLDTPPRARRHRGVVRRRAIRRRRRVVPLAAATITPVSATGGSTPTCGPKGLTPLIDHVRGLGMQFGIWVEPEMVNPD